MIDFSARSVMAIINVTPDSFYAESRTMGRDVIAQRVVNVVEEGAQIIDIGGYSSRPSADHVSTEEELERVLEGVKVAREIAPKITISIDTFRSEVAEEVLENYDNVIINDISAGEIDQRMIEVVAHYDAHYIAMHMRGTPQDMQTHTNYINVVTEVCDYLDQKANYLTKKGVKNLILDVGFGFAKTEEQNYELLAGMDKIALLGLPLLVGISRKSMIYKPLDIAPEDALQATTALHWECLRKGANILRVHDTLAAVQTVKLYEKYIRYETNLNIK